MVLMIIALLVLLGLCFGSFTNAFVWRIHEQEAEQGKKRPNKQRLADLSISKGRSMCPHCGHELGALDLVPVLSWLSLGGKCRYCRTPISWQYPVVELATTLLFVISWLGWPYAVQGLQIAAFGVWLVVLIGLMALTVYDFRWMLLPNRIVFPLYGVAGVFALINIIGAARPLHALLMTILAVALGGGVFYVLFQVSDGTWIGGGDVKLGWLLGLVVGRPPLSFLFIFAAALLGTIASVPLIVKEGIRPKRVIPFGPFLIAGAIISLLYGQSILDWYQHFFVVS
ncbi:MAG: putative Prepilin peptidase [Candidatus Saccharibacteria bacterium]|nr:putative Prepilin peptidase [Candidatus Saccharibacteria bacterium]